MQAQQTFEDMQQLDNDFIVGDHYLAGTRAYAHAPVYGGDYDYHHGPQIHAVETPIVHHAAVVPEEHETYRRDVTFTYEQPDPVVYHAHSHMSTQPLVHHTAPHVETHPRIYESSTPMAVHHAMPVAHTTDVSYYPQEHFGVAAHDPYLASAAGVHWDNESEFNNLSL